VQNTRYQTKQKTVVDIGQFLEDTHAKQSVTEVVERHNYFLNEFNNSEKFISFNEGDYSVDPVESVQVIATIDRHGVSIGQSDCYTILSSDNKQSRFYLRIQTKSNQTFDSDD
jgi:hypothetical protein